MLRVLRDTRFLILVLAGFYFATRLYNLTILPIFTDEAIYIYWSKFIAENHSHWFLSLTDGKPPVLTWIISIFLSIFPFSWYLIAGRLPSVLFGCITLFGTYKLTLQLFHSRVAAVTAALLVIFSPYLLLYDRLALYDAQLTAMLVCSVYFMVRTSKTLSIRDTILWGFFLGMGFLSKPPALFFLLLTPIGFLLLTQLSELKKQWRKVILLLLSVIVISQGMNNIQRVSGAYEQAQIKNQQFQQPIEELLKDPFKLTGSNLIIFTDWLLTYYTAPLFVAVIGGFILLLFQKKKEGVVLLLLWVVPLFMLATVGREIFPRYLVFLTPYALIVVAYLIAVVWHQKRYGKIAVGVLISLLISPMYFSFLILTNPIKAPLPTSDYNQLVAEHPSGYGLEKVFTYIRQSSEKGRVTVVTQGTFGLYPYAFYLEFWGDPNIRILPKWPLDKLDEEIYAAQEKGKVIVVLKEYAIIPPELHQLMLLSRIEKPNSTKYPILLTTLR